FFVARGEPAHGGEAADAHRRHGSFGTSANHDVGVTPSQDAEGVADGMGSGGARRTRRRIRASGPEPDRNLAGSQIDDAGWNKEWRDLARAAFQESLMLALNDGKSADAGSDENPRSLRQFRRNPEPRL